MASLRSTLIIAALLPLPLSAQNIGINANGATPNTSAMLDIDVSAITGTKRGLLIPRMTTTERNAIPAPATSLLIFNTTTAQFEYFDGTIWRALISTATAGWSLSGNAGINPATNFIGTTDAQPLRFRTGNTFAGQLSNTATGLVSYGQSAGAVNTGTQNTFIGSNAGAANTTGGNNTYVGTSAGSANVTGQQNVFIGRLAGGSATGSDNILIGVGSPGTELEFAL